MKHVYIETYGCQMNVADTEVMLGILGREGYAATQDPAQADVLLVNTCAVRDNAEQRIIGRMGEFKHYKRPDTVIGVVGCMAQRLGQRLLDEVPHVDLVIGPDGYRALPELIAGVRGGDRLTDVTFRHWEHYAELPLERTDRVGAFVTVQRGCDYRCTFCIVPMTRGRERSRTLAEVMAEVQVLAAQGTTEITLLGQTVNSWVDERGRDFGDLLRAVGAVDGIRRLRFTSPYPSDFTDPVIAAMAEVPAVCEHVHLPLQSGSTRLLKRMGRRYSREQYLDVVARLRSAIPALAITTDIIVGFPGETDDDFAETVSMVHEVGYDDAFTFRFSPREGTGAIRFPDPIQDEVAGARLQHLIGEVRAGARRRNIGLVGRQAEVLVEKMARRGDLLQTRTRGNKVVLIEGTTEWIGSYRTVRLTGTTGSTFTGVPVAEPVERELAVWR